jgi:RHS repeat-associated protein
MSWTARAPAGETTTSTYGPNGDLRTQAGPAGTRSLNYGLDGNLYGATLEDGRAVGFTYDEAGNRTSRSVNGTTDAAWVWDTNADQAVRTNETGTTTHRWFEDPQSSLGTAALEVSSTGVPTWLVSDFHGSVTGTIKTAGLTGTAKYGAFGEEQTLTGSMTSQPLQFQGQYKDSITGLYDMRLRDYNPASGSFTNTDPVAAGAGTPFASTYHFAYNQPTVLSDPSGACPWCAAVIGGAAIGGVIGGLIGGITEASSGGDFWKGAAQGAVTGAVTGALVGAIGPAGFGVAGTLLAGAGAGAAGNMAGGALGRHMNGQEQTPGAFAQDGAWGAAGGLVGGAGSYAIKGAVRAVSKGATRAADTGAIWRSKQNPGPRPADLETIECAAPGAQSAQSTAASSFGKLTHAEQGIKPYSVQRKFTAGRKGEIQAHHLIEQRFLEQIGGQTRDWPSVVITKAEHQVFTNQWLKEIPRGPGTRDATPGQINDAARKIYSGYPEFLNELGLK